MSGVRQLIREIHRRSLWQVLGIYLAGGWLALQAADTLTAGLGLPDWVPRLSLVLLVVFLPVVLATAFVQEGDAGRGARPGSALAGDEAVPPTGDEATPPAAEEAVRPTVDAGRGAGEPAATADEPDAGRWRGVLTWRNALLGLAAAFTLLGLGTGGYMASRLLGFGPAATLMSRGVLEERDRLVLTDFENTTSDSLLGADLTELLRIDLLQSPTVSVLEPSRVADALRRMGRDPREPLTEAVGVEVARREGLEAVIAGEVREVGGGYLLSARVVGAADGETLTGIRETAEDSAALIRAMDRLSSKLRERVGESLKTIRAAEPLEQVSTASLAALRKYTEAVRAQDRTGESLRAARLFEEAIALDSTFAMAYRKLGITSRVPPAQATEALIKAYEYRNRLTERERLMAEGTYHSSVTGDTERAIRAYRALLATYPDDADALNNLAILLDSPAEQEEAVQLLRRAIEVGGDSDTPYRNLVVALAELGRMEEARQVMREAQRKFPDNVVMAFWQVGAFTAQGRYDEADSLAVELSAKYESPNGRIVALRFQQTVDAVRGRLAEAEQHARSLESLSWRLGITDMAYAVAVERGQWAIWSREDPERAVAGVEAVLAEHPISDLEPLDRPYLRLAVFFAHAGQARRAAALLREYETHVPPELRGGGREYRWVRGVVALASGRLADAQRDLQAAAEDPGDCRLCPVAELALLYDRIGEDELAIEYFERYLQTPWAFRVLQDHVRRPYTLKRLAELYDAQGDLENAALYYARFTELWANADPELRPRVEAARARLEKIVRTRG